MAPPRNANGSDVAAMSLKIAIQMDPVEWINIAADSTFVLALEAQARGFAHFHYLPRDLNLSEGSFPPRPRHSR